MHCCVLRRGEECEWPINIPATMVPYESAVKMRDAMSFPSGGPAAHATVAVSFSTQQVRQGRNQGSGSKLLGSI